MGTKEDVIEAYKLMVSAREEEPTNNDKEVHQDDLTSPLDSPVPRGQKRGREGGRISGNRLDTLQSVTARAFNDGETEMSLSELLKQVNANLMSGEPPFEDAEFRDGLG